MHASLWPGVLESSRSSADSRRRRYASIMHSTEAITGIAGLEREGFAIIPALVQRAAMAELCAAIDRLRVGDGVRTRNARTFAVRNALAALPQAAALAHRQEIAELIRGVMGDGARIVRAIIFDKNPDANWSVPWHQDATIAVKSRRAVAGFGPWSSKAGVTHVQPPVETLESMLTLRLHLDDCDASNGALRVIRGSHRCGMLGADDIQRMKQADEGTVCCVEAGGAVLMKPLLLHSSSKATSPRHRRVLHLEYAKEALPGGLDWNDAA